MHRIDHTHPVCDGGRTDVGNGNCGCGHHNRWRHAAGITLVRLPDGTIATHRKNGTRIAPPL